MADFSRSRAPSAASFKPPSRHSTASVDVQFPSQPVPLQTPPALPQASPQRRRDYLVVGDDDTCLQLEKVALGRKLPFQYRGDLFAQRGEYTDASLYMSRLPPSRKQRQPLSGRHGASYKLQTVKLAPMAHPKAAAPSQQRPERRESPVLASASPSAVVTGASPSKPSKAKSDRKRQYALAVEAMAANRSLRAALLGDNVVPSVLALCRSKDLATSAACVATLGHLSCEPEGRAALLVHNALPLLASLAASAAHTHEKLLLPNCLGTLANLTVEDGSESGFIKDKALDCLLKQRRTSSLAECACTLAIFNLSCPQYSYPRVDDAVHALAEHGKDARERETVSRAVYNLACTRMNHAKLVEPESASLLRLLVGCRQSQAARLNALGALWHLVESGTCRRALVRNGDCVRVLVDELPRLGVAASENDVVCALATLSSLAREARARELMGDAGALDALAALGNGGERRAGVRLLIYRLLAVLLSAPANIHLVGESVFLFLLSFQHEHEHDVERRCHLDAASAATTKATATAMSRYVLFALASILSWYESEEPSEVTEPSRPRESIAAGAGAVAHESAANRAVPQGLDELLDQPQHLERIYRHVAYAGFPMDSAHVCLQMVLLYNLSFRYPKAAVARLAHQRLSDVGARSTDRRVLALLGGSFFSLCQEYEVHPLLLAAAYAHAECEESFLLRRMARQGDAEAQSMCLNAVCVLFDGRSLARDKLLRLIDHMFPVVVAICLHDARRAPDDQSRTDGGANRAALRAASAACLTRFASVAECRVAMVAGGLLDALGVLAGAEEDETLRLCVHTYALLSQDPAVGGPLLGGGVIKALTLLAGAPEEAVRRACAVTLCNLSASAAHVEELIRLGALRALLVLACVKSNDPETRRICLKGVLNLLRPARTHAVTRLVDDGLLWAFGLFANAMEARDQAILADALCVMALHAPTRLGLVAKPSLLTPLLRVLGGDGVGVGDVSTQATVLKGLLNLLAEPSSAALLLRMGVLPHLVALVETHEAQREAREEAGHGRAQLSTLVAELLVLLFQHCDDGDEAATCAFAQPATMRALTLLVRVAELEQQEQEQQEQEQQRPGTESGGERCARSCVVLLHLLSLRERTRTALLVAHAPLGAALPALLLHVTGSTQTLLLRCVYNLTSDAELLQHMPTLHVLPALQATGRTDSPEWTALCAGILRNLSTSAACHDALSSEAATGLLRELFEAGDALCREDAALATCNLFLGRVNSSLLLARGLLPLVLWLCSPRPTDCMEAFAMSSAVLRKVAIAPGNTRPLLAGGAVRQLVLLLGAPAAAMSVKTNCVATFCLLAQKPEVPAVLAAQGVVAATLELLEQLERTQTQEALDPRVETLCVDLLSTLAPFASAKDPKERALSSLLYRVVDKEESAGAAAAVPACASAGLSYSWESDRSFLRRERDGPLPPTAISSALCQPRSVAPEVRHVPRAISFPGYAVEVSPSASYIETGTIEPMLPPVATLEDAQSAEEALDRLDFTPPPMFPKLRTPFAPVPMAPAAGAGKSPAARPLPPRLGSA